jgi:uncharacterized protein YpiB (UPF0302 family)
MLDIHEDEIRELLVHYKFKERENKNLKEDIATQEHIIRGLRFNNDRLRKNNLDLIAQVEGKMGELTVLKNVINTLIEVNKETIEKMQANGDTPSEFIYAQTETFEKVVKLIDVQTQRFQKERLTEL